MSAAFDVASLPWQDMESAPRDGTIIAVRYHEWNVQTNPAKIQFAQWVNVGDGGKFIAPFNPSSEPYTEAWLPVETLNISIENPDAEQ